MALWLLKLLSLFIVLLVAVLFGLLPIPIRNWIRRREEQETSTLTRLTGSGRSRAYRILSYLNCFSGGVFLATSFIHLFPEVIERYNSVLRKASVTISFPIPELLVSVGFFLVLLIEHCVMALRQARRRTVRVLDEGVGTASEEGDALVSSSPDEVSFRNQMTGIISARRTGYGTQELPAYDRQSSGSRADVDVRGLRAFVLLLALSAHTVFAGLVIGLETSANALWMLLVAIVIHKSAVAFTIGLQFVDSLQRTGQVIAYILIFAVTTPIGIAIGTAISSVDQDSFSLLVSSMVLQGLATGTFLYVTFFEILQKEVSAGDYNIGKVFFIFIGFGAICLSKYFEG